MLTVGGHALPTILLPSSGLIRRYLRVITVGGHVQPRVRLTSGVLKLD